MDNFILFGTLILICAVVASAFQGETATQVSAGLLRTSVILILISVIALSL